MRQQHSHHRNVVLRGPVILAVQIVLICLNGS